MTEPPAQLADGLTRWTARHPEWHPGEWGKEVACFALDAGDAALLVDPLLPDEPGPVVEALDELARGKGEVAILITIPYHVRSSPELAQRYGASIHGHAAVAKRLDDTGPFRQLEPGSQLPGGATAHAIGRPRRFELPLHLPSHDAIAFGDAIVETGNGLRMWANRPVDDAHTRFYRERFVPTVEPLLDLGAERILVTHGEPVLHDGTAALREALRARPWNRPG